MIGHLARYRTLTGAMSGLILSLSSAPGYTNSCHKFSIWHYPWRQTCGMKRLAYYRASVPFPLPPDRDIALPDLPLVWMVPTEADDEFHHRLLILGVLRNR